jgi:hypothetical protein
MSRSRQSYCGSLRFQAIRSGGGRPRLTTRQPRPILGVSPNSSHPEDLLPNLPTVTSRPRYEPPPDTPPNRRAWPRCRLPRQVVVPYVVRPHHSPDWAILDNVSRSGVGLRLATKPEPGTTLYVQLHPGGAGDPINRLVRVVHVRPTVQLLWLVGGAFSTPCAPVDLQRILSGR